ncbi:MAG: hypothetical protein KBT34_06515 [Prevotella sp.]|nr:hypothetical protein [Candidatus Prevotella equi]
MKHLVQLLFAMLLFALPVETFAGKYLKDIAIGTCSFSDGSATEAKKYLTDNGYTVLNTDMNDGTSGWYVYIGYKTTDNPKEAITDIKVVKGMGGYNKDLPSNSIYRDGRTYYAVPVVGRKDNEPGILGRGHYGEDLFLWYTKSNWEAGVILNNICRCSTKGVPGNLTKYIYEKGVFKEEDSNGDFIAGHSASFRTLNVTKVIPTVSDVPELDAMFNVEYLGGKLYKIDIPLAAKVDNKAQGTKDTYIFGGASDGNFALTAWKNGGGKTVMTISRVRDKDNKRDFTKDWLMSVSLGDGITFYDPNTLQQISGNLSNMPVTSGNKVDKTWVTFLCKMPQEYDQFQLNGKVAINDNYWANSGFLTMKALPRAPLAPTGMNNITVVDPMLNMSKNDAPEVFRQPQGSQIVAVLSNNFMYDARIWDIEAEKFLEMPILTDGTRSFSFSMPSKDVTQQYLVVMRGGYTSETPVGSSTTDKSYAIYSVPFQLKPYHEIHNFMHSWTTRTIDEKGNFSQKLTFSWYLKNMREPDVLDDDQLILQRAHRPDFSDAQTIANMSLYQGTMDANNEGEMRFTYTDEEPDGWYDSRNDSTKHMSYYRVMRASAYSMWKNDCNEKYMKTQTVEIDNQIGSVQNVSVSKNKDSYDDKTVKVRVDIRTLMNNVSGIPSYIWDPSARIVIKRFSPESEHYQGIDYAAKTIIIPGSNVKYDQKTGKCYAEIEDVQGAPYTHYYYEAYVDASKSRYRMTSNPHVTSSEADANACYSETLAPFRFVEATKGTVKGKVAVEWEVDEGLIDAFELTRKEYNSSETPKTLTLKNQKATSYVDDAVASGKVYEYTVTAICNIRGKSYTTSKTAYGWNPYFGTLSGKVQMPNGALVTGPVTVSVKPKDGKGVKIDEVVIAGKVIVPAYDKVYEDKITTTNGTFSFDSIPYLSSGIEYEVAVNAYQSDVEYAGQKGKTFGVRINDALYNPDMTMVIADTKRFSGRVLYENSTIPVGEGVFYLNGYPLLDANGKEVKTDNKGNFSFLLPAVDLTLQVRKPGHKFANDGYVEGVGNDVTTTGAHHLLPTRDYDGLILYDNTKVRLAGRLIGGDVQGKLPLGVGVSKNNLGDDLKLVMELEGDDAANILFLKDQPDVTSQKHTYTQTITGTKSGAKEINKTDVTVERKRIIIIPDVKTGEFSIDLAPTKYKITEMSATGYPTLFAEGAGFEVLDVTNDTTTLAAEYVDDYETLSTTYNSRYQKVYHTNAKVTYTQMKYGMEQKILGAERINEYNLKGDRMEATVAKYDKETDKVTYTFGYPVFEEGKEYQLVVFAHEDFYYNGDQTSAPDVVHLDAGKLKVRNGLEDNVTEEEYEIDSNGKALIDITAGNTTFSLTEEDALRSLTMQVLNNGYYYEAEPLRAFVMGSRDKGTDVVTFDQDLTVVDVLRDPYGSRSYAYRERGAKYHWTRTFTVGFSSSLTFNFTFGTSVTTNVGVWSGMGGGAYAGMTTESYSVSTQSLTVPLYDVTYVRSAKYDMVLNDRIETSSDPSQVGAMADVYIGVVNTLDIARREVMCVIDGATYEIVKPAVDAKAVRIVSEGKDAEGKPYYIAIAEKLNPMIGCPKQFTYTQRHILSTVIPNLVQQYKSLILTGTREEIQAIANATRTVQYRLKDGKKIEDDDCYESITPNNDPDFKIPTINPESCQRMINEWYKVIATNENKKTEAMQSSASVKKYSISANQRVSHSEQSEWYDVSATQHKLVNIALDSGQLSGTLGMSITIPTKPAKKEQKPGETTTTSDDKNGTTVSMDTPGMKFMMVVTPTIASNPTNNSDVSVINTAGSGYVLETNDDSYLDMDVYSVAARVDDVTGFQEKSWDFISANNVKELIEVHDYIFVARGGAERMPWTAPDSTLVHEKGTPLGIRTMKIDNPKIYIDQPVMSNLPASEKAFFSVRLTNETEMPASTDFSKYNPSTFHLSLDDNSTADGAIITMDGMPLKAGVNFQIAPGQSITKTLQVERSGKAYDYDNIKLLFSDASGSLFDASAISVHYLPSSTPVKMVRPVDKWVMNTLSPKDDQGKYYIPIEVNGFDINYDNFDHIELQYKKQTEGDTKWVNLCSFYANEDLYNMASGERAMIKSGTITYRFYGDADPMEMSYDLRAVSFCRLGTGFVTSTSNVMSGLKDTRCPEVFGVPKPTNDVLTFQDVISIPFNEPIAYNYLDETANFSVTGIVNGADAIYNASLRFPDAATEKEKCDVPKTKVERNLSGSDLTWEGMVKFNGEQKMVNFMLVGDNDIENYTKDGYFYFTFEKDALWAGTNGVIYGTDNLKTPEYERLYNSLKQKLTHVAVTFAQSENIQKAGQQVHFYIDGVEIPVTIIGSEDEKTVFGNDHEKFACTAKGKISMGNFLDGSMVDVRLWDKALSVSEMNGYRNKTLSGQEPSLLGYWPMDELQGNVLHDKANGADMVFNRQTWQLAADQHSLRIDGQAFKLQNTEKFLRYDNNDYTLMSWFLVDQDKTVADSVAIFQSGGSLDKEKMTIYLNKDYMLVNSCGKDYGIATRKQATDGQWHSLAIVANKSLNSVALYFDGQLTNTISGVEFSGMQQGIQLGSNEFHGNIDNLSFWHLAFPANSIDRYCSVCPNGDEMGLVYYLPFERDAVNSQNMREVVFSTYNEVITMTADNKPGVKQQAFEEKVLNDAQLLAAMDDADRFSPVLPQSNVVNLPFSWTATSNELQINILETASKINHQYVSVTVRGVEDLAGNALVNPRMMMVYVDHNVLTWDNGSAELSVPYGEKIPMRATFSNKSGRNVNYKIQENCSWLRASKLFGTASPLCNDYVDFEISEGLAPGDYSAIVYLVDENNLSSSFTVNVTVEADEPQWEVTTDEGYTYSMNLRGQMMLKNSGGGEFIDMDKRDIVAAFYNGVCVGKANVSVDNEKNTSMVNMTIYGNDNMLPKYGKTTIYKYLTFYLWRANTNEICVVKPDYNNGLVPFVNNSLVGCPPAKPVIFSPSNEIKQTISLEKGWNWVSFNIIPKNDIGLNGLFESNSVFDLNDRIMHNKVSSYLITDTLGNRLWSYEKDAIDNKQKYTYQVYVQKPTKITVFGYAYSADKRFVTLAGSGSAPCAWRDLAYLLTVDQPINIAMSDFSKDRAAVGTIIKNRKQFAVMDEYGKWVGSLEYMHPGEGYFVKYFGKDTIQVKYTNNEMANYAKQTVFDEDENETLRYENGDEQAREIRTMMPVIANTDDMGAFEDGDEIVAFAKGNVIGSAKKTELEDGRQLFFISLNAEDGNIVRFAHVRGDEVLAKSSNGITYDSDGVTGTLDVPYTIDFSSKPSGNEDAYGISGEKYGKAENIKHRHGLFIIGNEKIAK